MRSTLALSFALALIACSGGGGSGSALDAGPGMGGVSGLGGGAATGGSAGMASGGSAGSSSGGAAGAVTGGASSGGAAGGGGTGGAPIICNDDVQCQSALGGDACKTKIACDPASATCKFEVLDTDQDGHPPVVCGGDDCDDGEAAVHPGASEVCDGLDNDCNGSADDGLTCPTCKPGVILLLLDRSGSMAADLASGSMRWAALSGAVNTFVQDSASNVLSVGVTYFPTSSTDCNAASYATPSVAIAALPGAVSTIQSSLASNSPTGSSILTAPISGAIDHLSSYVAQNPSKPAAVVVITDGVPNSCASTDSVASAAAAAAYGQTLTPQLKTYVVSLGYDLEQASWDSIALSGGTTSAYNTGDSGGQTALVSALNTIRTDLTKCP
jgi:Putative metal-binding motif